MTIESVILEYCKRGSIRATAIELDISPSTVRKCLITAGIKKTPLSQRIEELSKTGKTNQQIAELLGVSLSCVGANTPYSKGTYLAEEKTKNAQAIRKCRLKEATAQRDEEKATDLK